MAFDANGFRQAAKSLGYTDDEINGIAGSMQGASVNSPTDELKRIQLEQAKINLEKSKKEEEPKVTLPGDYTTIVSQAQDALKRGESWGPVWNRVRQATPATVSNEEIDAALGGSGKSGQETGFGLPYAYQIMTNAQNPGAEPYSNIPPEATNRFYGVQSPPENESNILEDLKNLISGFLKKKIVPESENKISENIQAPNLTPTQSQVLGELKTKEAPDEMPLTSEIIPQQVKEFISGLSATPEEASKWSMPDISKKEPGAKVAGLAVNDLLNATMIMPAIGGGIKLTGKIAKGAKAAEELKPIAKEAGMIKKTLPEIKQVAKPLQPLAEEARGIPKALEPLAQEAKKYKSAEEFIRAAKNKELFNNLKWKSIESGAKADVTFGELGKIGTKMTMPQQQADKVATQQIFALKEYIRQRGGYKGLDQELKDFYNQVSSPLEGGVKMPTKVLQTPEVPKPLQLPIIKAQQELTDIPQLPKTGVSLPNIIQQGVKPEAPEDIKNIIMEALYKGENKGAQQLYDEATKDFNLVPLQTMKDEIQGISQEVTQGLKQFSEFGDYQSVAQKMQNFLKFAGEKQATDTKLYFKEHIPRKIFGVSSDEIASSLGISENEFMKKITPQSMGGEAKTLPAIPKSLSGKVQKIKEMAQALKLDEKSYQVKEGFDVTKLGNIPSYKTLKPYRLPGGVAVEPTEKTLAKIAEKERKASIVTADKQFKEWQKAMNAQEGTLTKSQLLKGLEKTIRENTNQGINDALKAKTGNMTIFDWARTPENVFSKSGLSDQFNAIRQASDKMDAEKVSLYKKMDEWYNQVKNIPEERSNIFRYLNGDTTNISEPELKIANEVANLLSKTADRLGLPQDKRITHYITHIFEPDLIKKDLPPELLSALEYATPRGIFNPFLEKRLGASGYKEDVWQALDAYMNRALRKIYLDQPIDNMGVYVNHLPTKSAQNYVNSFLEYLVGRPGKIEQDLDDTFKLINDHIPNQTIKNYLAHRPTKKVFGEINQMIFRGALGLNAKSALKNLTQAVNTLTEEGPEATIRGYMALLNRGNLTEIEKQNLLKEMITAEHNSNALRNNIQKMDKGLFALFELAERINRGSAYFASKYNSLKAGLSEEDAIKTALSKVRKTQFGYGKLDTPRMLYNPVMKTAFQFSTFPIKQAELIGGLVKNKEYKKLMTYIAASLGTTWALGDILGIDWKDTIIRNVMPGLGPLPDTVFAGAEWLGAKSEQKQEEAKKAFFSGGKLLIPAGLAGARAIEGVKNYAQGASKTPTGRVRYKIEQTLPNLIQSIIFGTNTLPGAQKYYDKLDQPAKQKIKKLSQLPNIPQYNRSING